MSTDFLSKIILDSKSIKQVLEQLEVCSKLNIKESVGSSKAFVIEKLKQQYKNILVITDSFENERFLMADLETITGNKHINFPPTNQKPYNEEQIIDSSRLVQRAEALEFINNTNGKLVFTSAEAIFEKVAQPRALDDISIVLNKGDEINLNTLKEQLVDQNYRPVRFVDEPGEFAVRGGIVDVYPFTGEYPIRLEFFGDELDTIREFDPDSQRSIAFLNQTRLIPNLNKLDNGVKENFLTYFDENTLIVLVNPELIYANIDDKFNQAVNTFKSLADDDLPPPETLYLNKENTFDAIKRFKNVISFGSVGSDSAHESKNLAIGTKPQPDFHGNFELLRENITDNSEKGIQTVICCDNNGQLERFEELLGSPSPTFNYLLQISSFHEGFILEQASVALYTDHQIFNRYYQPKIKKRRHTGGISFKELKDLKIGDYVVHVDYGIGKFAGFKRITVKDNEQEVVVLRYQEDSLLYVNVTSLFKLQKYSGKEGTEPRITKLGSGEWARKKAQTKKRVKNIARELIALYAKRKSQKAYSFSPDNTWQIEMEANFRYEETPDQNDAIIAVKNDMQSIQPMDRLVCGDVGFGKTEVAVRAAFKAVMDNKQVGILVPTTILAEQHTKTFQERMGKFPVKIETLSRFRAKAEQTKILKGLENGDVNIVIGTHRLLSKDVQFKDLGLIIVDEEQRFGVTAKEKLKQFRAAVDVLTLTATPIPRTLQFSLMGARDLSVINTPPPNRQPIYTEIHSFNEELIRDALLQEMSRGGQVFFIHNRVNNIEEMADMIRNLVPDIRVRHAHGQMTGSQLEKIITDFYNHKFDVLVSTTIIENGIDIANANTIIINNAERFGLAELHQLRGRVGRSNRKAFCYLFTPPIETLTEEARKRLLALEEFSDLGSGFNIAMRDLDIRGAGDILGAEQSGFINDIGFDLYTKIVNDAVRELKESEFSDLFEGIEPEIDLPETTIEFDETALLPKHYVSDDVERLNLYRKLSRANNAAEIDDWKDEITDRFGALPKEAKYLIEAAKIKLFASKCLFTKVTIRSNRMWIICPKSDSDLGKHFYDTGKFQKIIQKLAQLRPDKYRLVQKKDTVRFAIQDIKDIFAATEFIEKLAGDE